jgi:hypothetical protein
MEGRLEGLRHIYTAVRYGRFSGTSFSRRPCELSVRI